MRHPFSHVVGTRTYQFADLEDVTAQASTARSSDQLAGVAADGAAQRVAARMALVELRLVLFLSQLPVP
jgi:ethanolamine ammonia-lyase large subunit